MTEQPIDPSVDPALLRGLTQRRFSRRDMLRYAGAGASAAFLAACGVSGTAPKKSPSGASPSAIDYSKYYGDGKPAGILNFENWELYIDEDAKGKHPSLQQFTKETGIKVHYRTDINDNDPFLNSKVIPVLQAGQDTGFDLMVITNGGPVEKLIRLGYLIPLDHSRLTNWAANVDPKTKNPNYDPGNVYTVPWQSGFTGIGYNSKYVKEPPTSFGDLLKPAYKGKVGMFANVYDLPCPALNYMGFDIDKSTPDQWKQAADLVTKADAQGIIRAFYDQNYIYKLEAGDIHISQAWSGDVYIAAAPKDVGGGRVPGGEVRVPERGPDLLARQHVHPHPGTAPQRRHHVHGLRVPAGGRRDDGRFHLVRVPGARGQGLRPEPAQGSGRGQQPSGLPERGGPGPGEGIQDLQVAG